MKAIKIVFKFILFLVLAVAVIAAGLFGYLTLTEYKPAEKEALQIDRESAEKAALGESYTLVSWNIGYGALGDNADFFMDGGKSVISSDQDRVIENLNNISEELKKQEPDFIFLQEVDLSSRRSYKIDEVKIMKDSFPDFESCFAYNYKVAFVPYPIPPLGKVESGLQTLSRLNISAADRLQLPCPFTWPTRLANLKRGLLVTRIPIEGSDKELILVNLHLEAYDSGEGKIEQTRILKEVIESEMKKGNYVIAGGDFNQTFSHVDLSKYPAQEGKWASGHIDEKDFSEDWQFLMSADTPSCRSLDQPYAGVSHEDFQYYVIDGYIVSPNVKVESFTVLDLDFVSSDHNPTLLKFTLE
ncbi:MAG: endonuclease [Lachnospiraceae bacterium]|nr:endonuclease [Lachnospiraceae bacterium]